MFIRLSFVTLAFALAALGTPLVQCDATGVLESIQQVDYWMNMFNGDLTQLSTMGFLVVDEIETAAMNMDACLRAATEDTNNNGAFTTDHAMEILDVIENHLEPDVKTALAELVSDKATVNDLNLASLAKSSLRTILADANDFKDAFIPKVPENLKDKSKAALDSISNELSNTISEYAN